MHVVHPICCGIDVHQAQLTACLRRVDTEGQVTTEVRECATTDDALFTLSTWLTERQCPGETQMGYSLLLLAVGVGSCGRNEVRLDTGTRCGQGIEKIGRQVGKTLRAS